MFNLAKGVLVVDPIEVRGIHTKNRPSQIYLLFQIGTIVNRSKIIPTSKYCHRWDEDSQCRFDIGPSETKPVLKVFLMEEANPTPLLVDISEVDLMDTFVLKNVHKWIHFRRLGQLNIEFTFYDLAPLIPNKVIQNVDVEQLIKSHGNGVDKNNSGFVMQSEASSNGKKVTKDPAKAMSAADQVFDESNEELSRFRTLVKRVKRRCKSVDYSTHPASMHSNLSTKDDRRTSYNLLEVEVQLVEKQEKSKPSSPTNSNSSSSTIEPNDERSNPSYHFDNAMEELDLNSIPFSAEEIGSGIDFQAKLENERALHQKKIQEERKSNYKRLSPEDYALAMRLEKGIIKPEDFAIERGASEYNGDGTWNKGCLRDSYRIIGEPPKLPPRIPVGMKYEEYYHINKDKLQTI